MLREGIGPYLLWFYQLTLRSFTILEIQEDQSVVVWKKLDQFEKKTWATRLDLLYKLHPMRLKGGDSAQEHIKAMTELFDSLSVAGENVSEEDRVVYLLASLPDDYNVLVTALEANEDVPKLSQNEFCTRTESQRTGMRLA